MNDGSELGVVLSGGGESRCGEAQTLRDVSELSGQRST